MMESTSRRGRRNNFLLIGVLFSVYLVYVVPVSNAAAVMSIDIGNEWMKVGVVSPGVPMEIALNKESKRKTPSVIAFRDNDRFVGEDAQNLGLRFPSSSFGYLTDLLGKTVDNPVVKTYQKRFPYHNIEADPVRNTVVFRSGDNLYSIEELIAQMLQKGREFAQDYIGQKVSECVLVVPGFFGQAERAAILAAAKLVDLKVLQLQNDYTAVALNYGIYRSKEINETAQYFVFYDMGALKTSATVVGYQLQKDKTTKETNPVASIVGVAYDRNLGGLEMQLRLRDYLADEFNAMKKTKTDVRTNGRAMAKLFKEAGRVKNVLSANTEHYAQIEGLIEEIDFKFMVTRDVFETLCADLFNRVSGVLEKALSNAHLTLDVVTQVIIVGGGTRVPKVQEVLKNSINQELGKNLNADEAATMGAVYRAADLATGFKVKKFVTKDAVLFPLQVVFEREGESGQPKQVKRTLFGPMNPFPQKKVITFNKHTDDFGFDVLYADLDHLSASEIEAIGNLNLTRIHLSNVAKTLELAKPDNIESKGIKAHFTLDDSGILVLSGAELVMEKTVKPGEDEDDEESPLSRLGSTITKLFSSGDDKDKEKEDAKPEDGEKPEEAGEVPPPVNATNANDTNVPEADASGSENKTEKVKIVLVKEAVPSEIVLLFTPPLDGDQLKESRTKIKVFEDTEKAKVRRETLLNNLESFVIDVQEKLSRKEYAKCATEEETANILKSCSEISEWLYEDGSTANADTYAKKIEDLHALTDGIFARHWEHNERPEALSGLGKMLEEATKFLASAANLTKDTNADRDVFTEVEIQTLTRVLKETSEWRDTETKEQKKLPNNVDVRLSVKSITEKMSLLDREVKYLVNKIKIWKPKVKETPKEETIVGNDTETQEEKPVKEEQTEEENVVEKQEGETIEPTEVPKDSDDGTTTSHSEL